MADSIQQPFHRFHISPEDLNQSSTSQQPPTIPILQRSMAAKSHSLKLREISPICVLVVGMAGSGKTTLMAALQRSLSVPNENNKMIDLGSAKDDDKDDDDNDTDKNGDGLIKESKTNNNVNEAIESANNEDADGNQEEPKIGYCLNLDPATKLVPFGASIDIRDTVDYKVRCFEVQVFSRLTRL